MAAAAAIYLFSAHDMVDSADGSFSWLASLLILLAGKFLAEKTHSLP